MAGVEPASRTLLETATTLIFDVLVFMFHDSIDKVRNTIPEECSPVFPEKKQMKLTCASYGSSAGYAIR